MVSKWLVRVVTFLICKSMHTQYRDFLPKAKFYVIKFSCSTIRSHPRLQIFLKCINKVKARRKTYLSKRWFWNLRTKVWPILLKVKVVEEPNFLVWARLWIGDLAIDNDFSATTTEAATRCISLPHYIFKILLCNT